MNTRFGGVWVLELTTQSAGDDRQRLAAEILTQLEIFKETETIALEIVGVETVPEGVMPAVLVQGTVLNGAYTVLPLVTGGEVGTLNNTTTGKTEHARMHVEEGLCQILTHAVLTTFPCVGGEQRDMLHISRSLIASEEDTKGSLRLSTRRLQCGRIFLPLLATDLDIHSSKALILTHGVVIHETHFQR